MRIVPLLLAACVAAAPVGHAQSPGWLNLPGTQISPALVGVPSDAAGPTCLADRATGRVFLAWSAPDAAAIRQIYVMAFDPATPTVGWQPVATDAADPLNVSATDAPSVGPRLVIDGNRRLWVVWEEQIPGSAKIFARFIDLDAPASWNQFNSSAAGDGVSRNATGDATRPDAGRTAAGAPFFVWQFAGADGPTQNAGDIFGRFLNGPSWASLGGSADGEGISGAGAAVAAGVPRIAGAAGSEPAVAWLVTEDEGAYAGTTQVHIRQFNGTSWTTSETLAGNGPGGISLRAGKHCGQPAVAVAEDGKVVVVYVVADGAGDGVGQVGGNVYEPGSGWTDFNGAWTDISQSPFGRAAAPTAAIFAGHSVAVAWADADFQLYARQWDFSGRRGAWQDLGTAHLGLPSAINDLDLSAAPMLAVLANGNPAIAWATAPLSASLQAQLAPFTQLGDIGALVDQVRAEAATAVRDVAVKVFNTAPSATIDTPVATDVRIDPGGCVAFAATTGDGDGDAVTVLWQFNTCEVIGADPEGAPIFGDCDTSTVEDPGDHTFDLPAVYDVDLTVTDAYGAQTTVHRQVTASTVPQAVIDSPADASTPLLPGESVTFAGSAVDPDPGEALAYAWQFGDSATPMESTSPMPGPVVFGLPPGRETRITVTLTVTDGFGVASAPASREIVLLPGQHRPSAVIDQPATDIEIRINEAVTFAGTVTDDDDDAMTAFLWTFGANGPADVAAEDPGPVVFTRLGTHTVAFNGRDANGLWDATPPTVTVTVLPENQEPEGKIDSPTGSSIIDAGDSVTFLGTGLDPDGEAVTYVWDFDGATATVDVEDPGLVTFGEAGEYEVQLTVTDARGLADATPARVTIYVLGPEEDLDDDGLPDYWEDDFGIDSGSALGDAGGAGDPDRDGLTNLEEFLADTLPLVPTYRFRQGWNLIAWPHQGFETTVAEQLAGVPLAGGVWSWDEAAASYFQVPMAGGGTRGASGGRETRLEPGNGYWLYCTDPTTLQLDEAAADVETRDLAAGWNLVGGVDGGDATFGSLASTSPAWAWMGGRFEAITEVLATQGFWIYTPEPVTAVPWP